MTQTLKEMFFNTRENQQSTFDYNKIPLGYYDTIAQRKRGMRSFWHHLKFRRVIDSIEKDAGSILDIGCFAGTFLGMIPETTLRRQVGVDILKDQIDYANDHYKTHFREFYHFDDFSDLAFIHDNSFDCITLIEVIEHLTTQQINSLVAFAYAKMKPGGKFIFTTPNYFSAWPLYEILLNHFSDVQYEEQHISRFTYFNVLKKLEKIVPGFSHMFRPVLKTTTHLATPFIAGLHFGLAGKISSAVSPGAWKIPLGALLLVQLQKL
jgi:2-polyprenyl-3-methyl-5-hydroxy-6-metoxy-1,4-benzoquinol methylase